MPASASATVLEDRVTVGTPLSLPSVCPGTSQGTTVPPLPGREAGRPLGRLPALDRLDPEPNLVLDGLLCREIPLLDRRPPVVPERGLRECRDLAGQLERLLERHPIRHHPIDESHLER